MSKDSGKQSKGTLPISKLILKWLKNFLSILLTIGLACATVGCILVAGFIYDSKLGNNNLLGLLGMPNMKAAVEQNKMVQNASSTLYDCKGKRFYITESGEDRIIVELNEIDPKLIAAFLAVEDVRFYEHHGIDPRAIGRAAISNLTGHELQGASTITQQLAKNYFFTQERTIIRKIREAYVAILLERKHGKDEILKNYLNQIYFGNSAYGVEQAALTYFGKSAKKLSLAQCAILAGIPKSPNYYSENEHFQERAKVVLEQMLKYDKINNKEFQKATEKLAKMELKPQTIVSKEYPSLTYFKDSCIAWLVDKFGADKVYKEGLKVYTTIDLKMQKAAETAVEKAKKDPDYPIPEYYTDENGKVQPQYALVAVEPGTGEVKAMIGGRYPTVEEAEMAKKIAKKTTKKTPEEEKLEAKVNGMTKDKYNRAILAKRQPGSSFKPFTYLAALDLDIKYYSKPIEDAPLKDSGGWNPGNSDGKFRGWVSMRQAIMSSINIPAIKTCQAIGPANTIAMAKKCGISTLVEEDENTAMAIGGLTEGVTPIEMAGAFSTFATLGEYVEPHYIKKVVDRTGTTIYDAESEIVKRRAAKPESTYLLVDMMRDVFKGTAGGYGLGRDCAGKTGTTDGFKDAWFVGYTPDLTTAVWFGNDDGEPLEHMYGGNQPATLWYHFMKEALQDVEASSFNEPPGYKKPADPVMPKPKAKPGDKKSTSKPGAKGAAPSAQTRNSGGQATTTNNKGNSSNSSQNNHGTQSRAKIKIPW